MAKDTTQINVVLDKDLHAKFKAKVALEQRKMMTTIVELIVEYIEAVDLPAEKITKF